MTTNELYRSKRSKIGNMMYDFMDLTTSVVVKHKFLYYFLNFTWGILTTLCGLLISLILICCGKKPKKFRYCWYFEVCKHWGGLEMGTMFLRDTTSSDSINHHEFGHTCQNAILGPFFIFLVAIPSAIRYWHQIYRESKGLTNKPYDLIWFEGSATDIGYTTYSKEGGK